MLLARRLVPLCLLLFLVTQVSLAAQAPFNACVTRTGEPIPSETNTKMSASGMAGFDTAGRPIIWWNAKYLDHVAEPQQLFVYLHECAHHSLGHLAWQDPGTRTQLVDENEANCWAVQLMVDGGMIRPSAVDSFFVEASRFRGDGDHLGGDDLVRSLRGCLAMRTDAEAWANALPPIIQAAATRFEAIQGQLLEAKLDGESIYASTLDLPGTYDCEVMGTKRLRCIVFMSKDQKPAVKRYGKLRDLLTDWQPEGWTHVENPSPKPPFASAFHMQDATTGVVMSLLLSQDAKLYFVVTAPQS